MQKTAKKKWKSHAADTAEDKFTENTNPDKFTANSLIRSVNDSRYQEEIRVKWRSGSHREPWLHVGNWGAEAAFVTLLNILPLSLLKAWFTNTTKALGSTCKKQSISCWSGLGPASRYHVRRWQESCCTALTSRRGCILSREEARDVKATESAGEGAGSEQSSARISQPLVLKPRVSCSTCVSTQWKRLGAVALRWI